MAIVFSLLIEIDDAQPMGPQIARARAAHVPWKVLENATGYERTWLWRLMNEYPHIVVNKSVRRTTPFSRAH